MKKVSNVETRKESYFLSKIKEKTERKCLVELKRACARYGYFGMFFSQLPAHMSSRKLSSSTYVFYYDEKVKPSVYRPHISLSPSGEEEYWALYKLNDEVFVARNVMHDSNYIELRKVLTQRNQCHSRPTGMVTQAQQAHVSLLDFYLLTGYSFKEWSLEQHSGGLVMEWDTTNNKCLCSVYYEPDNEKYFKLPTRCLDKKGIRRCHIPTLNFMLPSCFTSKGDVKPGQLLIDSLSYDDEIGKMKLTYEALPKICECCGKPIFMDGESHIAGSMCAPCVKEMEQARAIIAEMGITSSSDRLETTFRTIEQIKKTALSIIEA